MNNLQVFNNTEFGQVRTLTENSKILFCASDIANALGYARPADAVNRFCPHTVKHSIGVETGKKADGTPATQQIQMNFIPEGDVYRLIVRSKLPNAEMQIEMDKPKVLFADAVATSKTSILIGELAKLIKQNGYDIGQKRLFNFLRENGYLVKRKGSEYNMPTQKSMNLGLFEIKERTINHTDHVETVKTPKVTGKGQIYFLNLFFKIRVRNEVTA